MRPSFPKSTGKKGTTENADADLGDGGKDIFNNHQGLSEKLHDDDLTFSVSIYSVWGFLLSKRLKIVLLPLKNLVLNYSAACSWTVMVPFSIQSFFKVTTGGQRMIIS